MIVVSFNVKFREKQWMMWEGTSGREFAIIFFFMIPEKVHKTYYKMIFKKYTSKG